MPLPADTVHYAIFTPAVSIADSGERHSSEGEDAPGPSTPTRGPPVTGEEELGDGWPGRPHGPND
eukprot:4472791-Heterocapsa_arctica.AAC.1